MVSGATIYLGEQARFAAEYLNADRPSCPPITRIGEDRWSVIAANTAWDEGRAAATLELTDAMVVAMAVDQHGDTFGDWVEARKRQMATAMLHESIAEGLTPATRSIPDLPAVAAAGRPSAAQEPTSHA